MGEREVHLIDACAHDGMQRGNVVIDTPAAEIVIAYDDGTALRRGTALTREQAFEIAGHVRAAFLLRLSKRDQERGQCQDVVDAVARA